MSRERPSRDWVERVRDILAAIAEIQFFTAGMSRAEFLSDAKTIKAVLANFSIIGEAARHVPDEVCLASPDIAWRQMRDMRNFIVHVYFAVEPAIVWETIQSDLPNLATRLTELIATS
ncbi:MAG: DUF86 domain-containing protein [Planctomycetota bacterium]|nr:DUF86 domain-containing protein [Planctomycetota bacterium]